MVIYSDPPFYSPIGIAEWKDTSHIKRCWKLCDSAPARGDVFVLSNQVGIVTLPNKIAYGLTIRSSLDDQPLGIIVEDDWGFREGQTPICWRFKYKEWTCFSFFGRW